ncbi:MAG: FAD-dependent oxidoreductase [Thermoplasmata archaeon]|nr:FAD-dependent oxidoreductase [Thermoplasmata archaeon]
MENRKRIVVIGGSAAGPKAAARARRLDQNADIVIIQKGPDFSMASCGYPYYVGGVFDDRCALLSTPTGVIRGPGFFQNAKDIRAIPMTEATLILRDEKAVLCKDLTTGEERRFDYDKLIIATGSKPNMPPIPGIDLDGITTLQSMKDADLLRKIRDEGQIKKAIVVGGGLIGMETCEALNLAGIDITVIEMMDQIMMFMGCELAKLLENHVRSKAAHVITGNGVVEFLGENGKLSGVKLGNGLELPCELAVMAIGVKPNVDLAKRSGIDIGELGGISVDGHMVTSDPDIYAIGDCVEVVNRITGKMTLAPFGDLANLQGRVAGENVILGNTATFPGTIHTSICKVFDFSAGSTGLSESKAREMGYDDIVTVINAGPDKPGFMSGLLLVTKMIADRASGKILGVQCMGPGDVSKQIAQSSIAIQGGLTVDDLVNSDLPYAPPFTLAIDNLISTSHIMQNKIRGYFQGISTTEVKGRLDKGEDLFLLDLRGPDEYEAMRLGVGESLIPLGALRKRLNELPGEKDSEIICFCKISLRGYEGALILQANGWTNVKVMEGGIMAWQFSREK